MTTAVIDQLLRDILLYEELTLLGITTGFDLQWIKTERKRFCASESGS